MNQAQAAELLELLRQMNQALGRIEKLLDPVVGPPSEYREWPCGSSYHTHHTELEAAKCLQDHHIYMPYRVWRDWWLKDQRDQRFWPELKFPVPACIE